MNYTLETKGSGIVPVVTEKRNFEPRITGMDEFKTSHATRSTSLQIGETQEMTFNQDEHDLARLGYKQEFARGLGLFENWTATFTSMNFVSGIPVLFGWVMYTGGPTAALANWTMVGGLATILSLSLSEIAASLPTAGGLYYWSFVLGGERWGRFASWMTAWWNWTGWVIVAPGVQQGSTLFLVSALEIAYPDSAVLSKGWFTWLLTCIGLAVAMLPNIINQRVLQLYYRCAVIIFFSLLVIYWIWFPIAAAGNFQSTSGVFDHYYNGINNGNVKQASDGYAYLISILFGAWVFFGYDASAHLAEETQHASKVVAKGMWMSTVSAWVMSVPTLIMILYCIQDFDGILAASYANNWAAFLVQLIGKKGAIAILVLLWADSTCATASCFMSAQRVTYAISRDGVLPFSHYFAKLSSSKVPVNAALLVYTISCILTCSVIGSSVAFSAITSTGTVATMVSYSIPIIARHTSGRDTFQPASWNLGRFSRSAGIIAVLYIAFLFVVLILPQEYPVTRETLNYAPIAIGIITIISVVGWWLPFGYGGRSWFKGPRRTIEGEGDGGVGKEM